MLPAALFLRGAPGLGTPAGRRLFLQAAGIRHNEKAAADGIVHILYIDRRNQVHILYISKNLLRGITHRWV